MIRDFREIKDAIRSEVQARKKSGQAINKEFLQKQSDLMKVSCKFLTQIVKNFDPTTKRSPAKSVVSVSESAKSIGKSLLGVNWFGIVREELEKFEGMLEDVGELSKAVERGLN